MTWLGYIPAAIACFLVISAVLAWLLLRWADRIDQQGICEHLMCVLELGHEGPHYVREFDL